MRHTRLWRGLVGSGLLILAGVLLGGWRAAPGYTRAPLPGPSASPTAGCVPAWSRVGSPSPGSFFNNLYGVVALAANDVWAVGGESAAQSSTQDPLLLHWTGSGWSAVPAIGLPDNYNLMQGIDGVAANDLWAVGGSHDGIEQFPMILHWNGTTWTEFPGASPYQSYLEEVSALAANDVWVVGVQGTVRQPLIEHWNGSQWMTIAAPAITGEAMLYGVSAVAANDVWAVGVQQGAGSMQSLVIHWDGTQWTIVPSPNPGIYNGLNAVAARAANDVWAVGRRVDVPTAPGLTRSLVLHWDGATWTSMPLPTLADADSLNNVVALAPDNAWAVGTHTWGCCTYRPLALHWDGTAWDLVPLSSSGSATSLLAVAAVAADDIWAVGATTGDNRYQTLTTHYAGGCATPTPTPTACPMQFSDVPPSQPFYPYIRCLACRDIVSGYSDGTFQPGAEVTRAQLAKFVANAADFSDPIYEQEEPLFADVPPGHPFRIYIERAFKHQVISGHDCGGPGEPCPGRYFRPANPVTRAQTAKFVANAAYYADPIPAGRQTFADVPPTHPFWIYIERAAARGVISGYQCGGPGEPCDPALRPYFRPPSNVIRGQAAKFIANAIYPNCQTPAR